MAGHGILNFENHCLKVLEMTVLVISYRSKCSLEAEFFNVQSNLH